MKHYCIAYFFIYKRIHCLKNIVIIIFNPFNILIFNLISLFIFVKKTQFSFHKRNDFPIECLATYLRNNDETIIIFRKIK